MTCAKRDGVIGEEAHADSVIAPHARNSQERTHAKSEGMPTSSETAGFRGERFKRRATSVHNAGE